MIKQKMAEMILNTSNGTLVFHHYKSYNTCLISYIGKLQTDIYVGLLIEIQVYEVTISYS